MSSFGLKMLAMFTMLIDHIGVAFHLQMPFSVYWLCRVVGRLAMPLFCFMIAEGLFHTRDAKRYLLRLTMFALVSEVPFDRLFQDAWLEFQSQNVGFTLLLGFIGILMFDSFAAQGRKTAALISILAAGTAAVLLRSDYEAYGVYFVFIFYFFRGKNRGLTIALAVGAALIASEMLIGGYHWQYAITPLAAVGAAIPITLYNDERGRDGPSARMALYAFYPAHLLILYALKLAL